jgi:4,4'-diaponeurosporenoate glycosyltransferase
MWRLPVPAESTADGEARLSVIIPARDEEGSLPRLLASLAAQDRPADEVIVVDDHSTDRTATLATSAGARVVAAPGLPAGWTGKTWACHQGAVAATGDVLVFLDADVHLAPAALSRLAGEHARHGGLVSVQPRHVTRRRYERLSAVANVVALMATGAFSPGGRSRPAMAFGPCLIIGRGDYHLIGGHSHPMVRPLVLEDIGLARRCRQEGIGVRLLVGGDVVSFRMYPGGVASLVEGWTKGLAYGARHSPPAAGVLTALWVTGALMAAGDGWRAVAGRRVGSLAGYGAWAAEMGWLFSRVGDFGAVTAVAFPVPLAAFVALTGRSAWRRVTGRPPRWRGRNAPVA